MLIFRVNQIWMLKFTLETRSKKGPGSLDVSYIHVQQKHFQTDHSIDRCTRLHSVNVEGFIRDQEASAIVLLLMEFDDWFRTRVRSN